MKTFQELYDYGLRLVDGMIPIDESMYSQYSYIGDWYDAIGNDYHFIRDDFSYGGKNRFRFVFCAPKNELIPNNKLVAIEYNDPKIFSLVSVYDIPDNGILNKQPIYHFGFDEELSAIESVPLVRTNVISALQQLTKCSRLARL